MINGMGKRPYVVGILGVVMFLIVFVYAYTIFVKSVSAQQSEIIREGLNSNSGNSGGFDVPSIIDLGERFLGGASRVGDDLGGASRGPGTKLINPVGFKSLGALIAAILDIIVQIAVPIAALFLIYSGYLFVYAQGDETKLGTAKSIFLWTMVGIAVILGAKILASVIENTINQFKG